MRIAPWLLGDPGLLLGADPNLFRELLRITIDPSRTVAEKVDVDWELLKGWGGESQLTKKIVILYNSDKLHPIPNSEHMKHFLKEARVDSDEECIEKHK